MKRRDCLAALGAAGLGAIAAGGCRKEIGELTDPRPPAETTALPLGDVSPTVRLLHRAGFGPAPGDVVRVEAMGRSRYLDEQLFAPADDDGEATGLLLRLHEIEVLDYNAYDLLDWDDNEVLRQLQQAALLRAVYSKWQLRERMVDFWSNHFNIYARKALGAQMVGADTVNVIRQNALGTFPEMLRASARSPAMLAYLDNQQNRVGVANENYARELMELHTLGVGGGYTQKDVQEVARCLTGWTIEDRFLRDKGAFRFDAARHDDGPKQFLGHRLPLGGGEEDGILVLDYLAHHPQTAHFIARKLTRYFHGSEDETTVGTVSAAYRKTGGDIKAMLRPLLAETALASTPPILKRPYDFLVSSLRATGADTDGSSGVQNHLEKMGQPLYQWPMPDGYPDKTAAWTGSLLARWNFALALAHGQIKGTALPKNKRVSPSEVMETLLSQPQQREHPAGRELLALLTQHAGEPAAMAALVLCSPAFQWS